MLHIFWSCLSDVLYEMDLTQTVGATERTQDAGQMDRQTDGQTEWNKYTPQQLCCAEGIITMISLCESVKTKCLE